MFTAVHTASLAAFVPTSATPSPSATVIGWASNTLAPASQTAAAATSNAGGIDWVFLGSIVIGLVTALFAYIGISQIASSRRGDVRQAGRQSAVAAIGTFWVALAIGGFTTLLVTGMGSFLSNVFG